MTHLPFIVPSYVLAVAIPAAFAVAAMSRLAKARRQLRALDPRAAR